MSKIMILSDREKHYGTYRCVQKIYLNGEFLGELSFERDRRAFYCRSEVYGFFRGKTIAELKRNILKEVSDRKPCAQKRKETPCKYLPAADNADFYPTPAALAGLMFSYVKWDKVFTVLEPSAGKGDLCDCFLRYGDRKRKSVDVDCIEYDANLRLILKGKGFRVVHDDFLSFDSRKRYDLIMMNPPFSNGEKHLLKAIEMQKHGGQIVCLLNAETLRNPYTILRKELIKQIGKYHASVRYIKDAFKRAERRTNVTIALVYLNIPAETHSSSLFERIRKAEEVKFEEKKQQTGLILKDKFAAMVSRYNAETAAVLQFFEEYNALAPEITGKREYSAPDVQLYIGGEATSFITSEVVNRYLRNVRYRFWRELLDLPDLQERMTSKISNEFYDRLQDLRHYDFTEYNINEVLWEITAQLHIGVESEIEALFDKLSAQYSYYDGADNVHYYNGWTTNKAYCVNKKVILPYMSVFDTTYRQDKYGRYKDAYKDCIDAYKAYNSLRDIEKVLYYLAGAGEMERKTDLYNRLHFAENRYETKNIDCTFFDVTFYKKGTAHVTFNAQGQKLIDRLNAYIGIKRQWLPPTYGKRRYADMTEREQEIVREFNGSPEAYDYVVDHADEYLLDVSTIPLLA